MEWLTPLSTAGLALVVIRWWRRRRHEQTVQRELTAANGPDLHVASSRLSPALTRVAEQAHRLRLVLETPARRIRRPLLTESPWRRRERCDEYDTMLGELRRAVWEWMRDVERLSEADLTFLSELGLSTRSFRSFLFARIDRTDDPWEQVVWRRAPDVERVHKEVLRTILELRRFEQVLTGTPASPYRAAG